MGMQLRFKLNFLLMGIRLRAVAPDVALLLDTGFFTLQVVGRPTGLPSSKGASSHSEKALQWRIGLEGLSIAATSCHQRPGSQGRALARDHAVGGNGSATPKTWVLAHVRKPKQNAHPQIRDATQPNRPLHDIKRPPTGGGWRS